MRAKIIWPHLCRLTSAARFPALKTKQPFLCGVTHHAVIRAEQLYFLGNSMLNAYICTFLLTSFSSDGINMCIYFACDYLPPLPRASFKVCSWTSCMSWGWQQSWESDLQTSLVSKLGRGRYAAVSFFFCRGNMLQHCFYRLHISLYVH